jgi:hypothetical protein
MATNGMVAVLLDAAVKLKFAQRSCILDVQHYAAAMHAIYTQPAQNQSVFRTQPRSRTVPIPNSITPVPGYPDKLVVFKIAASKYWQMRCWLNGVTHRKSAKTQSLRVAQSVARRFYEQLIVGGYTHANTTTNPQCSDALDVTSNATITPVAAKYTFAAVAARMLSNEHARVERGEYSSGSLRVLQNRMDAHILPRWAMHSPADIDYSQLLHFTQYLSATLSSITVSQYLIAVRKVLQMAVHLGVMKQLPEFPKVKIVTTPRGAFTPTEYWRILRMARRLSGQQHPATVNLKHRHYKLRTTEHHMPADVAWVIGFMVNSFIRPSDLRTLKHRHVEVVRNNSTYLRLTLPQTKLHGKPIVTLQPAVRLYEHMLRVRAHTGMTTADDYLFLPELKDRQYAQFVLAYYFNWILAETELKAGPHGQSRTLYSLRHSAITFRLLYGQGIDLLTLARNARTSVDVINNHYASTVSGEQNITLLQSRRKQRYNQH